ncbi:hypothetical protein EAG_15725 [Camponotus floridanus]|uniref:Uncharacterized protein n=1 Tax=Camponotus floridanus TaxID=104421 RepID=E2AXB6_CAMFO|nr:hypothetical protein EAG_15725 [Camponotus floridanus]
MHTLSVSVYNVGNPTRYSNCRFSTGHRGGTLQGTAWCHGTIILSFHRRHHHRHLAALILPVSRLNGRICHNPFQHLHILNLSNISGFLYIITAVLRAIFQRGSYRRYQRAFSFFSIFRRNEVIFSLRASGLPSPVKLLEGHGKSRGIAAPGIKEGGGKRNWRQPADLSRSSLSLRLPPSPTSSGLAVVSSSLFLSAPPPLLRCFLACAPDASTPPSTLNRSDAMGSQGRETRDPSSFGELGERYWPNPAWFQTHLPANKREDYTSEKALQQDGPFVLYMSKAIMSYDKTRVA